MIDLTGAPEDATHYDKYPVRYFKYSKDKRCMYSFTGYGWIKLSHWPNRGTVFKIPDWSIHNNTKLLRDLSDEQRGLLFNSWVKDKDCIEFYYGLMEDFEPTKNVIWDSTVIYRVRQKSERELFIEEWSSKIATAAYRNESISQLVGEMFDVKLRSYNKE